MEKIVEFLQYGSGSGSGNGDGDGDGDGSGYGYGYGSGSGSGYGNGDGDGSGSGYGYGNGDGDGSGSGYGYGSGSGSGYGIKQYNRELIHNIDGIPTGIYSIRGDVAKGFILNEDWTITDCYIVKGNNYFAHGSTLHEAFESLQEKINDNLSITDRIAKFKSQFPDFSAKYSAKKLFSAHNLLTGSCLFGRKSWCENNKIDLNRDSFTVYEFIELTKNAYGGDVIKQIQG